MTIDISQTVLKSKMPRYDFLCHKCKLEFMIFLHDDQNHMDISTMLCQHCFSPKVELTAYYKDQQTQINSLQQQIQILFDRLEEMGEKVGVDELDGEEDINTLN